MTRINGVGQHRAERRCTARIKIRYCSANELPPGLHATAERHGRTITVYLLPGLTAEERNAALRRLRLSGRMRYGPRLPAVQLAFALFADRIRTSIAQAGSVFRAHPAGTTGPVMLISAGAIAFLVLSAVSIRILREPHGPNGSPASGPAPAASAIAVRIPGSSRHLADDPVGSEGRVLTAALTGSDPLPLPASPGLPSRGSGAAADTGTASTGSGLGTGGGGTPVGAGADSTPNPTASAAAPDVPSATASVSPSAADPPAPVPSSGPTSASIPAPAPSPVSASAAPSVSASVAPSVSVSGSGLPSVSASVPVSVSASVAPSVSVSVPASAYTSNPVAASASVTATVSASLPTSGSPSSAGSSAPAQSPVSASVTGGACLDVGPLGVCLDV
jgi:hypothetical protein